MSKRIVVDISNEYHDYIKKYAIDQNISIKILVLRGIALLIHHNEEIENGKIQAYEIS